MSSYRDIQDTFPAAPAHDLGGATGNDRLYVEVFQAIELLHGIVEQLIGQGRNPAVIYRSIGELCRLIGDHEQAELMHLREQEAREFGKQNLPLTQEDDLEEEDEDRGDFDLEEGEKPSPKEMPPSEYEEVLPKDEKAGKSHVNPQ